MRKDIDKRCERWADWWAGHIDQSAIGYPSKTVEARMMTDAGAGGVKAGCVCPEVMMPPSISATDRIINTMPKRWQTIIIARYVSRERVSKSQYVELDRIHHYMMGRLDVAIA